MCTSHRPLNGADSVTLPPARYPINTDALLGFLDVLKGLHADDEQALMTVESVRIYVTEVTRPDVAV